VAVEAVAAVVAEAAVVAIAVGKRRETRGERFLVLAVN
jgi:hypothetical protein